jgi:hypothetical protein
MALGEYMPQGLTIVLIAIVIQNLAIFIYERIRKINYTKSDVELITYMSVLPASLSMIIFGYILLIYPNEVINIVGIIIFICLKSLEDIFMKNMTHRIYDSK